jgi:hypothetical protein
MSVQSIETNPLAIQKSRKRIQKSEEKSISDYLLNVIIYQLHAANAQRLSQGTP